MHASQMTKISAYARLSIVLIGKSEEARQKRLDSEHFLTKLLLMSQSTHIAR